MYPTNVDHQQNIFKIGNPSGEKKSHLHHTHYLSLLCYLYPSSTYQFQFICLKKKKKVKETPPLPAFAKPLPLSIPEILQTFF